MDATPKVQVNVGSLADMGKRISLAWNRALIVPGRDLDFS